MCEQCLVNPIYFGTPLKGLFLARARRDGNNWKKGEWGLIESNDPSYIWRTTPVEKGEDEIFPYNDDFEDAFICSPREGWRLIQASIEKGYDNKSNFMTWLWNYLAKYIKTAEMEEGTDPFPHLESSKPSDLTIGRDPIPGEPT